MPTALLIPNPPRGKRPASKGKPVAKKKSGKKGKKKGAKRGGMVYVPMRANPPKKSSGKSKGGGGFKLGPIKVPAGAMELAGGAGAALIVADLAMTKAAAQWPGEPGKPGFFTTTGGRATVAAVTGAVGGGVIAKTFKSPKAGLAFAAACFGLAIFGAYSTTETATKMQAWAAGTSAPRKKQRQGTKGLGYWNPGADTRGLGYWNPGQRVLPNGNGGEYAPVTGMGEYGAANLDAVSQ